MAQLLFSLGRPIVTAQHCAPLNRVRVRHGMPSLGHDLRRIYTDADYVLYADSPHMFPLSGLPGTHRYLGPLLWSPPGDKPDWWTNLPSGVPIVYLTLGSSGSQATMAAVVSALSDAPVTVIASSAGAPVAAPLAANIRVARYLPGIEAAARADLVVCNGGIATSLQALAAGVPVLGLPANMDQFLNMNAVKRLGAGASLRDDRLTPQRIRSLASKLLDVPSYRAAAARAQAAFAREDAAASFNQWMAGVLT